jgi:GNAT superfamily N-acetyltransferase
VPWDDPVARALRDAQQVELSARYGDDGTPEPPAGSVVATLVVALDGVPAACGSLRDVSDEHGAGTGEVKRVYVDPAARGRGLARVLMRDLEARALARGWTRLVLEAGLQQPEAIGLYLSLGYEPVERYGEWADVPDSRCFAKALPGTPRAEPEVGTVPPGVVVEVVRDDDVAVVARRDGRVVGSATLVRQHGVTDRGPDPVPAGRLHGVHVAPEVPGSGVAAAMVRALEAEALAAGLRDVVVEASIREPGALALYRALGYRPVLPFGDWEGDPDGLYLARTLAPPAA